MISSPLWLGLAIHQKKRINLTCLFVRLLSIYRKNDTLTFHECIHASGHESRLARKSILEPSYFGSHEYSKEELVAEMGAAFLCGHCGIEHKIIENSAAYIQGWLKALKNDKTLLVHAAAAAQKAADYILNINTGDNPNDCFASVGNGLLGRLI